MTDQQILWICRSESSESHHGRFLVASGSLDSRQYTPTYLEVPGLVLRYPSLVHARNF